MPKHALENYVDAHVDDTADAHDASAISTSGATPSNVQAVLDDHEDRLDGIIDGQVFTGEVEAPSLKASGKTGLTATPITLGGGLASGTPGSGAHVKGELAYRDDGTMIYCTAAGTPGTWVDAYGNLITTSIATHDADPDAHPDAFDAFAAGLPAFDPAYYRENFLLVDDFANDSVASGSIGELGWTWSNVATGAIATAASDLAEPGVRNLSVTAVSDQSNLNLNPYLVIGRPTFIFEARVRINNLPSASHEWTTRLGICQAHTIDASFTDGAIFQHSYNGGNTSWLCRSRNASGTIQETDTNVDPTTSAWQRLGIICDGSAYYFYIDGTLHATHTTIAAAGIAQTIWISVLKTVGSAARTFRLGRIYLRVSGLSR